MAGVTTNQTRWNAWKRPRLVIWHGSWGNVVLHIPLLGKKHLVLLADWQASDWLLSLTKHSINVISSDYNS